jgi:hypothetical protein
MMIIIETLKHSNQAKLCVAKIKIKIKHLKNLEIKPRELFKL